MRRHHECEIATIDICVIKHCSLGNYIGQLNFLLKCFPPIPDRSYMRLTEKENETLPIDVSVFWDMHPFTLFTFDKETRQKLLIIGLCFRRSYCRHYCRLSWLATVSSTSPESSKIWTPHRNWKTSRFICALFHRSDFHPFPYDSMNKDQFASAVPIV